MTPPPSLPGVSSEPRHPSRTHAGGWLQKARRAERLETRSSRFAVTSHYICVALFGATAALSQVSPNGSQFQVNSMPANDPFHARVAMDDGGNFVVVWHSLGASGPDTSGYSIHAQRFAAGGAPLGTSFQVNSNMLGEQRIPDVAMSGQGGFIVAWQSQDSSGTDIDFYSIQARRYAADGSPVGAEFQVNSYTTAQQVGPAVAWDDGGEFVIAWSSLGSSGGDASSYSVQAQRFAADGSALGAEFQVNAYTTSYQVGPDVAYVGLGEFVVTWSSNGSGGTDSSSWSVQGRRYDSSGAPLSGEFQINTITTSVQVRARVSGSPQAGFVVVWDSDGSSQTDTDGASIQLQRFDSDGAPQGGELQVNSFTTGTQFLPAIASDDDGDFVVVWTSFGSYGSDASGSSIQGRRFQSDGSVLADEFQVNGYTTDNQRAPMVTSDPRGNFVVVWKSLGSATTSGAYSVQAQRFDGLFRDGFETGDSDRWSAIDPAELTVLR